LKKYIFLIISAVIISFGPCSAYTTRYVHIVVIDGARYSETFGDTAHKYIPCIWNNLKKQGTIFTNFYNDSVTVTVPGHSTIITGVYQDVPNDGAERPNVPTLFEYFRKEKHSSATDNFVILGKEKLNILSNSTYPQFGESFGASVKYSDSPYEDIFTLQNFKSVLSGNHPNITITNLGQVDRCGHNGVWEEYLNAIHNADSIINEMWKFIQSDPIYKNKTTLILTNDHGRHTNDFTSHGCECDGCRHIILMMLGPDTKAGVIDSRRFSQNDIAPTAGELLNFSTPYCTGKSILPVRAPAVPELLIPKSNSKSQPAGISLLWKPVTRALNYHIQLSTDSLFTNVITNDSLLKQNSTETGRLYKQTMYYWRVKSRNSEGSSAWSEIRSFSTLKSTAPDSFSVDIFPGSRTGAPLMIKYGLPLQSVVSIRLYSIDGTFIKSIHKGMQYPDYHIMTFDNMFLASGKYLLDFEAGQYKVKKPFTVY